MSNKDKIYNALTNEFVIVSDISKKLNYMSNNTIRNNLLLMIDEGLDIEKKNVSKTYIHGTNRKTAITFAFRLKQYER